MKVQINLKIKTNSEANETFDLVVRPGDTIASIKEKVTSVHPIPFEQELSIEGKVLNDEAKLSACGICDGTSLVLDVKPAEATLTSQLTELLQARDLSADELGLLYCYKNGASINQALKLLGFDGKLQDFIDGQKTLSIENGVATVVRKDTSLKPFAVVDEVVQILKAHPSESMDIKELSAKFVAKFGCSLASIVGSKPGEFLAKEKGSFVLHGRGLVSLPGTRNKTAPPSHMEQNRCAVPECPIDAPPGLGGDAPPGLGGDAPPGLGGVKMVQSFNEDPEAPAVDYQQYMELHNRISSRSHHSAITQKLNDLIAAISEAIFLDIDHVVTGGCIGKGTAIVANPYAQVTLFLRGLPLGKHEAWLAPLLKAVAGAFSDEFRTTHGIESIHVREESLQIHTQGSVPLMVDLHISPTFENYQQTLQVLEEAQSPESRKFYAPSLTRERTQFVARQPATVKATIRLVQWWRDQQEWYGPLARPSDELLELATIYSANQTKPADQKVAIANVMSLLSRFDHMRVVWSNNYSKDAVWTPLLRQRPLLMDPANPYVNVADPKTFDCNELMVLARTTHFFW